MIIIVYHHNSIVTQVLDLNKNTAIPFTQTEIKNLVFELADQYPYAFLLWCEEQVRAHLNVKALPDVFNQKNILATYNPGSDFLPEAIGYVDSNNFVKINKEVRFPTWRMSSVVGGLHAQALGLIKEEWPRGDSFDYFLTSFAKLAMPMGLRCYSEPRLLDGRPQCSYPIASYNLLFKFVSQHYKRVWILVLWLALVKYENRPSIFGMLRSFFYYRRSNLSRDFNTLGSTSAVQKQHEQISLDVLIPTIGRKEHLQNFLNDLAVQTLPPHRVIVVEQSSTAENRSELDFLSDEWPFDIVHKFINRRGACNARNLALEYAESEWIFFADDDIRISPNFLRDVFEKMGAHGGDVFTISCLQEKEVALSNVVHQTSMFGSGCSIARKAAVQNLRFHLGFEFGFGEDNEFGMQIRNRGYDIYYFPSPVILHRKAPIGGFRTKPSLEWEREGIQPKPSPTVMLYKILHHTKQQRLGYKIVSFFKFYRHQHIRNPIIYKNFFLERWKQSEKWAKLRMNN